MSYLQQALDWVYYVIQPIMELLQNNDPLIKAEARIAAVITASVTIVTAIVRYKGIYHRWFKHPKFYRSYSQPVLQLVPTVVYNLAGIFDGLKNVVDRQEPMASMVRQRVYEEIGRLHWDLVELRTEIQRTQDKAAHIGPIETKMISVAEALLFRLGEIEDSINYLAGTYFPGCIGGEVGYSFGYTTSFKGFSASAFFDALQAFFVVYGYKRRQLKAVNDFRNTTAKYTPDYEKLVVENFSRWEATHSK